jgi:hypothetical protein
MAASAGAKCDRLGAKFSANSVEPIGDLVQRLIPTDAFPLTRTARTDPASRILQAVRMIYEVNRDCADRAQAAVVERRLRIALDFDKLSIAYMQKGAAAAVT